MANKGWNTTESGTTVSSNARTTMRVSGRPDEEFIRGSDIAHPGPDNDTLETRADLFDPPGQLGESHGCSN
jgi:hypothetical protein